MNILFLSSWFPYPPINGAKIRIFNLLRELAQNHDITLITFARTIPLEDARKEIHVLKQYCKSVEVIPAKQFTPDMDGLATLKGYLSLMPRSVSQTKSPEMEELIIEKTAKIQFDVVIASEVGAPGIVSLLASKIEGVPKILDALEIGLYKDAYYNQTTPLQRIRHGLTWLKQRSFTKQMLRKADACTVPSLQEQQNLEEISKSPSHIEVVPHSLDLNYYEVDYGPPEPGTIVFTGSFTYFPNEDAVRYFLNDIFPIVKTSVPTAILRVLGSIAGVNLDEIASDEDVDFTGLITDVRPMVARSFLSVVPLRYGAGTRLKIIESLALGTPVVSTNKGAEGLSVTHGKNILIADEPEEFAQAVIQVMKNDDLRRKLSDQGRRLVVERYSSIVMGRDVNCLLQKVVKNNNAVHSGKTNRNNY